MGMLLVFLIHGSLDKPPDTRHNLRGYTSKIVSGTSKVVMRLFVLNAKGDKRFKLLELLDLYIYKM